MKNDSRASIRAVLLCAAAVFVTSCSSGGATPPPVAACTPGGACTPANACHVGVQACQGDALVCSDTSSNVAEGTTCGLGSGMQRRRLHRRL